MTIVYGISSVQENQQYQPLTKQDSKMAVSSMTLIGCMTGAYLGGSINFSILLSRLLGKPDPRTKFSRNAGATNVFRQAGWLAAGAVLLLDMARAAAVALLAKWLLAEPLVPWTGFCLILGNRFPCFHGFNGGKGVANYLGFYTALLPLGVLSAVAVYLLAFAVFRVPFIGSFGIVATLTGFGIYRWCKAPVGLLGVLVTASAIVWFHRENIAVYLKKEKREASSK